MPEKEQFVGRWVHWDDTARIEQELFADGRFEGVVFDEERGEVFGTAKGHWEIVGKEIRWRYIAAENLAVPKKVDVNEIVHVDENRFDARETSRRSSDWYRAVESEETSTNFDYEQVQPFLTRISALIDGGFGAGEIAALMKKIQCLRPDQTSQLVFPVTCAGVVAPFRIRVFMDDVDAPDIYFYAPLKLARQIDNEIKNLD
jgi:hypothetical protein